MPEYAEVKAGGLADALRHDRFIDWLCEPVKQTNETENPYNDRDLIGDNDLN